MDSLFVSSTNGIDFIKGFLYRVRAPIYKAMALERTVTDVVNFRMSKDCRSELDTLGVGLL